MKIRTIGRTGYLVAAMLMSPAMSLAARSRTCKPGQPTEETYTWNFHREAAGLLKDIEVDARKVENQADELRSFSKETSLSWQSHASELTSIKGEVNDMGAKLCRLETIRRAALPWQKTAIDRTAVLVREMANNTTQAIRYLNDNHENLWSPTYEQYASNLYNEGSRLSRTVGNFEDLAKVRHEERDLRKALGVRTGA